MRINLADATPQWQNTASRTGAAAGRIRKFLCAVLLPTGQVFLSGGVGASNQDGDAVLDAEIYSPGIDWNNGTYTTPAGESWATLEAATVPRNYHSVALLLPDGRVWTAGSSKNAAQGDPAVVAEKRIEVYSPAYVTNPNRPDITAAPLSVSYGETFDVRTPQAANIRRVALIRNGSVTHALVSDQRYVGLEFTHAAGDRLTVTAPPSSAIAPPGHYMLWIVDDNGLPCKLATFMRVTAQRCFIITDRSSFSVFEVEALLGAGAPAAFPKSLYVVFEGFLPAELGTPLGTPTLTFTFDLPGGAGGTRMSATLRDTLFEDPASPPDITQRVTFVFDVQFADANGFATFVESRNVNVRASLGSHICDASLGLIKQPNPYMLDGEVTWLSTDLRVFQIRAGQVRAGIVHESGPGAPSQFIDALLTKFNTLPNDEFHPFRDISTDQQTSVLELAREVNGQRVYNFAVAKVRYRAAAVPATNVKVFFRLFNVMATGVEFNPSTSYRHAGTGTAAIALLGLQSGEVVTIPFFGAPRIDSSTVSMTTQTDALNQHTLQPAGAQEATAYFGCWLDFNQTEPQFPLNPTDDGPYGNRLSIQELVRGHHCCLVSEIYFEPTPIPFGANPASNDKLSQRNLAVVQSQNPGNPATHTVQHTFELKPSAAKSAFETEEMALLFGMLASQPHAMSHTAAYGPDELVIFWNNLPRDSRATLYLPDVDTDLVLRMAAARQGPALLERVDDHTIRCQLGDVAYIPLPGGRSTNIPGLLSIELPATVVKGQVFTVSVHQYSGVTHRMLGAFQLTIPVTSADLILPGELRKLSVLRHIFDAIPPANRWYPVFVRYLDQIADRVRGLGGDPDSVAPSPDGTGRLPERQCCHTQWLVPALLAPLLVLIGLAPALWSAPVSAMTLVLVLAAACHWYVRCKPKLCDFLIAVLLGVAAGAAVLGVVALSGYRGPALVPTLAVLGILGGALVVASLVRGCWGECWCGARREKGADWILKNRT